MNLNKKKLVEFIVFLLIALWCIGIFWEIIYSIFPEAVVFSPFLKYNYSIVCHTQPEKLFAISDFNSITCSRCTGIYLGSLFSSILVLIGFSKIISLRFLLLTSIPMLLDVIIYSLGIYSYSKYLALSTGLLLGSIGFLYIHNSIIELLIKQKGQN